MKPLAEKIKNYLVDYGTGHANAITIDNLSYLMGARRRAIEMALEELRDTGLPVVSECKIEPLGVFYAETIEEGTRYHNSQYSRIQKMSHRVKMIEEYLQNRHGTQLVLGI